MSDDQDVTLPAPTVEYLMAHDLFDELDAVAEAGGNVAMIRWLDQRGLSWHAGGTDPGRALADSGLLDLLHGAGAPGGLPGPSQGNRAQRRAAQRGRRR